MYHGDQMPDDPSGARRTSQSVPMDPLDRITTDPQQCGGRPCVRGMRIRVKDVLGLLDGGMSREAILAEMPDLEADDISACIRFRSRMIRNRRPITNAAIYVFVVLPVVGLLIVGFGQLVSLLPLGFLVLLIAVELCGVFVYCVARLFCALLDR